MTPARALIAELVRRYWILGIECSLLEVQKLAYLLEDRIKALGLESPLDLRFEANRYGPFSLRLSKLHDALDGSYLHCEKRLADAGPFDVIWFEESKKDKVSLYLSSPEAKPFRPALEETTKLIDGFESPLGMELIATVHWLLKEERVELLRESVKAGLKNWAGNREAAERKLRLFEDI